MLRTISTGVLNVVRESDERRNELRFEFAPEFEAMLERAHTDDEGNVNEIAIEQMRIDTLRAACAMLTAFADRSETELDEATG